MALAGGFAVVKRSDDPRADFRLSMADMVVGCGIYITDGVEHLLRCFLAQWRSPTGATAATSWRRSATCGRLSCPAHSRSPTPTPPPLLLLPLPPPPTLRAARLQPCLIPR